MGQVPWRVAQSPIAFKSFSHLGVKEGAAAAHLNAALLLTAVHIIYIYYILMHFLNAHVILSNLFKNLFFKCMGNKMLGLLLDTMSSSCHNAVEVFIFSYFAYYIRVVFNFLPNPM